MTLTEAVSIVSTMGAVDIKAQLALADLCPMLRTVLEWRQQAPARFCELSKLCGHYAWYSGVPGRYITENGFSSIRERLEWLMGEGAFWSTEALRARLRCDDRAIRKAVFDLREQGYAIEYIDARGYRLGSRVATQPPTRKAAA